MQPSPGLAADVGGIIGLEYGPTGLGLSHGLHLAVLPFDPAPSGGHADYLYTGSGSFVSTENGVLATFAAVGDLWAPYYPSDWSLRLSSVYQNRGGFCVQLPTVPSAAAFAGTAPVPPNPMALARRRIALYSQFGKRWRVWLRHIAPVAVGQRLEVTADDGGIDARDRAWLAYVAGTACALVGRDGTRFQPGGKVDEWWDAPVSLGVGADGTGYVVTG